jgi:hypothetical protein
LLEKSEEGKITLEKMMVISLEIDVPKFKTPYKTPQGSILLKESNRNVILGKGMSDKQPGNTPSDNANSHTPILPYPHTPTLFSGSFGDK